MPMEVYEELVSPMSSDSRSMRSSTADLADISSMSQSLPGYHPQLATLVVPHSSSSSSSAARLPSASVPPIVSLVDVNSMTPSLETSHRQLATTILVPHSSSSSSAAGPPPIAVMAAATPSPAVTVTSDMSAGTSAVADSLVLDSRSSRSTTHSADSRNISGNAMMVVESTIPAVVGRPTSGELQRPFAGIFNDGLGNDTPVSIPTNPPHPTTIATTVAIVRRTSDHSSGSLFHTTSNSTDKSRRTSGSLFSSESLESASVVRVPAHGAMVTPSTLTRSRTVVIEEASTGSGGKSSSVSSPAADQHLFRLPFPPCVKRTSTGSSSGGSRLSSGGPGNPILTINQLGMVAESSGNVEHPVLQQDINSNITRYKEFCCELLNILNKYTKLSVLCL